jgi:hypothetical protein
MNAVTRPSNNKFHGSAFCYDRNSALATAPANLNLFPGVNFGPGKLAAPQEVAPKGLTAGCSSPQGSRSELGHSGPNL